MATPAQEGCDPEPHSSTAPHNSQGLAAEGTEAPENAETGTAPVNERKQKQQKGGQQPQHAALSAGVKALKPRKKDFLKRRKLKKKGLLHLLDEEPEEDLEAELMQDRHKPKFGEQAMAPLKASPAMLARVHSCIYQRSPRDDSSDCTTYRLTWGNSCNK